MESTSQLIRFSIPGSIFVLAGVGTYALAKVLWDDSLGDVALTTLTAAVAVSIPVGFLVYQLYYWRYSPFVIGDIVTRDRGREALAGLPPDILARLRTLFDARLDIRRHHRSVDARGLKRLQLLRLDDSLLKDRYKDEVERDPEDEYFFERDDRSTRRIYKDNWYENWDVFRAVLDFIATRGETPEIKRNFTTLYDIYHALGASRLAVLLGAIGGVMYLLAAHPTEVAAHLWVSIVGLWLVVVSALFMAYVLHRTRIATWKSAVRKIHLDLVGNFSTNQILREALPAADGFTPRMSLRRRSNERLRSEER
jgi:hypothetical protein